MYGFETEYLMLAKSFHLKTEILCKLEPDALCISKSVTSREVGRILGYKTEKMRLIVCGDLDMIMLMC